MTSSPGARVRARLFDADRPDEWLEPERAFDTPPSDRQLLWIDVDGMLEPDVAERLASVIELRPRTVRSLRSQDALPLLSLNQAYVHVRIAAEPSHRDAERTAWLDLVAGRNVVVTAHGRPIEFLDDVDDRIERHASTGDLSAAAFFTILVGAAIASYHAAVDAIEADVDRLDTAALRGDAEPGVLSGLVRCRRRIAGLRRLLADHRSTFTALESPELKGVIEDPDDVALVASLAGRFEAALSAVEESREALLGSFDVYMSRTAQRTNEVMKVLTLATVLLLPGSLIAGLLGMNVSVPLNKDDPSSFWLVVGAIAVLAIAIVVVARARRWL